jgi:hypothetical protein
LQLSSFTQHSDMYTNITLSVCFSLHLNTELNINNFLAGSFDVIKGKLAIRSTQWHFSAQEIKHQVAPPATFTNVNYIHTKHKYVWSNNKASCYPGSWRYVSCRPVAWRCNVNNTQCTHCWMGFKMEWVMVNVNLPQRNVCYILYKLILINIYMNLYSISQCLLRLSRAKRSKYWIIFKLAQSN